MHRALSAWAAAFASLVIASPSETDASVPRSAGLATKKVTGASEATPTATQTDLLATLVQTHTDERVLLEVSGPSPERFATLLSDRVTGEHHAFDPKLLELLRALAKRHTTETGLPRIELVSGYRSPKLNEMMRKKGRHVASHSQHSLGHAVDFRIVQGGQERGVDPRVLEQEIRELGWEGGVGVYTQRSDWFVHADVGAKRRWGG